MSTSTTHQQSFADSGSDTRPPMLERGSYIPWAVSEGSQTPTLQTEDDLTRDDLKHYEAEIEAMNLILISILNDIYNSVDACTIAQAMWQRVERLMRGTVQNKLINDLERNRIKFPRVTVNTKFLKCLQPEWLKYVTQVRLAKRLTEDSYDDLFDYLSQNEKLVNASRAKKLKKYHDPLALVAHTDSSFRIPSPYYVTHPSSVADYDDDYQGDAFQNNFEDPLISAMMLLARAITRFSNPTNNHLRTSSNTRNQAIVQGDKVNIQSRNSGNDGRNTRRSFVLDEIIESNNVQNDAGNIQRTLRTTSSGSATNMLLAKQDEAGVTLTDEQNDFLVADATRMEEIENPKLYDASCFSDSKICVNVRDTEDILDDATKSQKKMENKLNDPIAIEKKQNFRPIDYNKLNALYEDFVSQKELSDEQK
ncbi:hypothetical protein Tco_0712172 [Tanacetum coccineum]